MKKIHLYRLRPYHNPEGVDESKVSNGWRFLYADEAGKIQVSPCRVWLPTRQYFDPLPYFSGSNPDITYIVPVDA